MVFLRNDIRGRAAQMLGTHFPQAANVLDSVVGELRDLDSNWVTLPIPLQIPLIILAPVLIYWNLQHLVQFFFAHFPKFGAGR